MSDSKKEILNKSKPELLKVGLCIEFDSCFDNILNDLNKLSDLISNYKNLFENFPNDMFEDKVSAIHSDINFVSDLLFNKIDPNEDFCKYMYKYND